MTRAETLYRELIETADAYDNAAEATALPAERLFNRSCAASYRHAARRAQIILRIPFTITGEKVRVGTR